MGVLEQTTFKFKSTSMSWKKKKKSKKLPFVVSKTGRNVFIWFIWVFHSSWKPTDIRINI